MTSITNDKHIKFVLENYADISALDEMMEHAQSKVPDILRKLVLKCINELDQELDNLDMIIDEGNDWYSLSLYDPDKEIGLFFGCEGDFDYMFFGDDPDGAPYLYLFVDTEGVKKRERKAYIDKEFAKIANQKIKAKFRKAGIVAQKKDHEEPYLLTYPLYQEINLETIKDKEKLTKAVKKAVLDFTNEVLKIYSVK